MVLSGESDAPPWHMEVLMMTTIYPFVWVELGGGAFVALDPHDSHFATMVLWPASQGYRVEMLRVRGISSDVHLGHLSTLAGAKRWCARMQVVLKGT